MSHFFLLLLLQFAFASSSTAQLRPGYYAASCPRAENIVRSAMKKALLREPRSLASVMRFQFHDCFVNGCDASMLLDDAPNMLGEKLALSNINSLRSYEVIDEIKEEIEEECPGVVSCADIIIMASRDAVALTGGPHWEVKLGRLDSLTARQDLSNDIMPSPRSNASYLISLFQSFNLTVQNLVALSGSHTLGQGRCFSVMYRIYNQSDPTIDPDYLTRLHALCPRDVDQNVTVDLDSTPLVFDNMYFGDLVRGKGFLNSDETLMSLDETASFVRRFSVDEKEFFEAFVEGMVKMGDLQSGKSGEIRRNCRVSNRRKIDKLSES